MTHTLQRQHGLGTPTHAVIWLHGLGASANDFEPVAPYLGLEQALSVRFIFPQAPDRPITINGGYVMPGWYDIKGMDMADKEDRAGITESQSIVEGLIAEQVEQGIPSQNIILAGFSQGGAVALFTAVRSHYKIAGVLALSTYLPFMDHLETEQSKVNLSSPILAMHGTRDPIVPLELGKQTAEKLSKAGYLVAWKEYDMEHSVAPEQLPVIGQWMNQLFKRKV